MEVRKPLRGFLLVVHDVRVVGSCVRKDERPDSDVDFLVKFSEGSGGQVKILVMSQSWGCHIKLSP